MGGISRLRRDKDMGFRLQTTQTFNETRMERLTCESAQGQDHGWAGRQDMKREEREDVCFKKSGATEDDTMSRERTAMNRKRKDKSANVGRVRERRFYLYSFKAFYYIKISFDCVYSQSRAVNCFIS